MCHTYYLIFILLSYGFGNGCSNNLLRSEMGNKHSIPKRDPSTSSGDVTVMSTSSDVKDAICYVCQKIVDLNKAEEIMTLRGCGHR